MQHRYERLAATIQLFLYKITFQSACCRDRRLVGVASKKIPTPTKQRVNYNDLSLDEVPIRIQPKSEKEVIIPF